MSDGDIVIIHKQENFESGQLCVLLINGDEATVKRVYKLENGIELVAINPAYPSRKFTAKDMKNIPVQVIGVVKQLIKNY
ncbi:MAG: S26 family signal peptidase [Clostridia bacterium]|nr:S26 family signal peptidase [Clostridia bacterium]